jgi:thioredoxin 1
MTVKELVSNLDVEEMYRYSSEGVIIIDFFTDWCNPCKRIAPEYENMSEEYKNIRFYKCNGESQIFETEFRQYVDCYPTFLFIKDMNIIDKCIGGNSIKLRENIILHNNLS